MVRTSDDARDLLKEFADRHGISVSALLEAIARRLPSDEEIARTPRQQAIIAEARAIDVEKRGRG